MFKYLLIGIFILFTFYGKPGKNTLSKRTEIHGHRGFRGYYPENTLTSFKEAVKIGVDAIELDVIISKDSQVVVSHEPWFNYRFCTDPSGERVRALKQGNLYKMDYAEIRKYDCGSRPDKEFPLQKPSPEYKPLLSEVIRAIDQFCSDNGLPLTTYNIEIKSGKIGDGKWHPEPQRIAELLHAVLKESGINDRILVQSFDIRSLQAMHRLEPELRLGLLIANTGSVEHNIRKLGFTPYMYNPALKLTKEHTVKQVHEHGCKIYPWTVNREADMKKLMEMGVDGLITDYPDIALKLRKP
jgi:glycerophosphoryl diester phosphodiesterase